MAPFFQQIRQGATGWLTGARQAARANEDRLAFIDAHVQQARDGVADAIGSTRTSLFVREGDNVRPATVSDLLNANSADVLQLRGGRYEPAVNGSGTTTYRFDGQKFQPETAMDFRPLYKKDEFAGLIKTYRDQIENARNAAGSTAHTAMVNVPAKTEAHDHGLRGLARRHPGSVALLAAGTPPVLIGGGAVLWGNLHDSPSESGDKSGQP